MSISCFSDKSHPPELEEIHQIVGPRWPLWQALTDFVAQSYAAPQQLKFYGRSYGWMVAYHLRGKTLVALYPQEDGLVAQVILGPNQVAQAMALSLGKNTNKALQEAKPYPEGRWLFIPIKTASDVRDVQELLRLKAQPSSKPARRGRSTF